MRSGPRTERGRPAGAGRPRLMDVTWMRRALRLAETARGRTSPNPLVGAVVLDREGRLAGEGFHRRPGEPHAEVEALRAAGERARGGTLYVTLEPCNHHGRTPPCTEAIVAAGVARVVVAWRDPNRHVRGGGIERLQAAGLSVEAGVLEAEAARQNAAYARLVTTGRPLVTLKLAASLDGRIATASGESRWITGEAARRFVHELRDAADAVAVGVATVLADDPQLTARVAPRGRLAARLAIPKRPLWRVVVDPTLRLPEEARVLVPTPSARTLVACGPDVSPDRRARLEAAGVSVVSLPRLPEAPAAADPLRPRGATGPPEEPAARGYPAPPHGRLDLGALLDQLGRREVADLLVEGGAELAGALLDQRLVDRIAFFYAPILIGGRAARGMIGGAGAPSIDAAARVVRIRRRRFGDDLLVEGDVVWGDA